MLFVGLCKEQFILVGTSFDEKRFDKINIVNLIIQVLHCLLLKIEQIKSHVFFNQIFKGA